MTDIINIIIILFLVFLNGFFVATEFAMVKVRKSRIETLVFEGSKNAKHTLMVVNDLNSYLSACQLGITLASLGLGWIGEPSVAKILMPIFEFFKTPADITHSISFILGFIIITGFHIVLGELAPKSVAIINTERLALITSGPLILFYKITYPIMLAFNHSTNLVLKIFGLSQVDEHESAYTDDEIKLLVEDSYKHGLIDHTERTFVDNIFEFSETTVKDIMVPRTDMQCIFLEDSFEEIIEMALNQQLTRYPACRDSKDNVVGFINIKDLYKLKIKGENKNIESIIREIKFVPESLSISEMIKVFQKEKIQMAVIIDEYGGTEGLVTIEDILEEIVGEIQDEFDEEGEDITNTKDGNHIVDGKVLIEDINDLLGTDIDEENIDTIGGWIYSQLKAYPQINEKIEYEGFEFVILKCDRKRISKLLIRKQEAEIN